jgi:hypothetical protein
VEGNWGVGNKKLLTVEAYTDDDDDDDEHWLALVFKKNYN